VDGSGLAGTGIGGTIDRTAGGVLGPNGTTLASEDTGGTIVNVVVGGGGAAELAGVVGDGEVTGDPAGALASAGGAGAGTTTTGAFGACATDIGASRTTAAIGGAAAGKVETITSGAGVVAAGGVLAACGAVPGTLVAIHKWSED